MFLLVFARPGQRVGFGVGAPKQTRPVRFSSVALSLELQGGPKHVWYE